MSDGTSEQQNSRLYSFRPLVAAVQPPTPHPTCIVSISTVPLFQCSVSSRRRWNGSRNTGRGGAEMTVPAPVKWSPDLFVAMDGLTKEWRLAFNIECPKCHAPTGVACAVRRKNGEFYMSHSPHKYRIKKGILEDPDEVARREYLAKVKNAVKDNSLTQNVFESEKPPKWTSDRIVDKDGRYAGRYGLWEEE